MTATVERLPPRTPWPAAFAAAYAGQLARVRVARVPLLFVATLQSLGLVVLLRGVLDRSDVGERRQVVAGAVVLVIAFVGLNLLAQRFGMLRAAGALDYYAALPVPPSAIVLGAAASYATFAVPGTVVVAGTGALLYDLPLRGLWVLPVLVLAAGAALSGIGALVGLAAPRAEVATVAGQLGMTLVLFLGMVQAERMPLPLEIVRAALPSSHAADALASSLDGHADIGQVAIAVVVCLVWAAVALGGAGRAFRRAVAR